MIDAIMFGGTRGGSEAHVAGAETHTPGSVEAFLDAFNDIDTLYDRFAQRCGTSTTEYWILESVCEGMATQRDICAMLALNRQTVNSATRSLVRRGLVRVEATPGNGRTKTLVLTEEGQAFAREHIDVLHRLEEDSWHALSEPERLQLTELLNRYRCAMRDALEGDGS